MKCSEIFNYFYKNMNHINMNYSVGEYSELIEKVLNFLKENKISQNIISERINYYSLSKVKNFQKYPQKIIEGKNRAEVFNKILDEFSLYYDNEQELFKGKNGAIDLNDHPIETTYYVIYYYSLAKQIVGKGLVSIKEKKWATINFNDPNHTHSLWKGTFDVIESYSFLSLEKKGDTAPVKAFYSFFSGTIKYGRPILIGTYSTIKRDGSPTAGNIVMEKVNTKEAAMEKINSTTSPNITSFLLNKNFTLTTITPPTIKDLPKAQIQDYFVNTYNLYWLYNKETILKGQITINNTTEVNATIENKDYNGIITFNDSNTLQIEISESNSNETVKSNTLQIYLNVNNFNSNRHYISAVLMTTSLLKCPTSLPVLLVKKEVTIDKHQLKNYFNQFQSPIISTFEPIELISFFK